VSDATHVLILNAQQCRFECDSVRIEKSINSLLLQLRSLL
jgi:hypothetical protein